MKSEHEQHLTDAYADFKERLCYKYLMAYDSTNFGLLRGRLYLGIFRENGDGDGQCFPIGAHFSPRTSLYHNTPNSPIYILEHQMRVRSPQQQLRVSYRQNRPGPEDLHLRVHPNTIILDLDSTSWVTSTLWTASTPSTNNTPTTSSNPPSAISQSSGSTKAVS